MARQGKFIILILTLAFLLCGGCAGVTFQFGGGPPALPVADKTQRCIQANRIVTRPARAQFTTSQQLIGSNITLVTTHWGQGLIFYRGQTRLTAEQVLDVLGNPSLRRSYRGLYRELLATGSSRVSAGKWTFGIGIAAGVVGMAVMFAAVPKMGSDAGSSHSSGASSMLWAGLGVLLGGTLVTTIGGFIWKSGQAKKNLGESYQTIFLSPELRPELQRAIAAYNRGVEQRCGAGVPPLPKGTERAIPPPQENPQPPKRPPRRKAPRSPRAPALPVHS